MRASLLSAVLALALGCQAFEQLYITADQLLYASVPTNPVTGMPVFNAISEAKETANALDFWHQVESKAQAEGIRIDFPGPRYDQIQRVFRDLADVARAHRRDLPWQVHLIDVEEPRGFTVGGGVVVLTSGLFELFPLENDNTLAVVLSHEIAHVAMLHGPLRVTWAQYGAVFTDRTGDPYYSASYTTSQEADADRLGILYMALAGYDPSAGAWLWVAMHRKLGDTPARAGFLHDHPVSAERAAITTDAAKRVARYYVPRQRNPRWQELALRNSLFSRSEIATEPRRGAGILKGIAAGLDAAEKHGEAKEQAKARKQAAGRLAQELAQEAAQVQLLRYWGGRFANGQPAVWMRFYNGSSREVAAIGVQVIYWGQQQPLDQDNDCGGPARIPRGQTVDLACEMRVVPNADQFTARIFDVRFR